MPSVSSLHPRFRPYAKELLDVARKLDSRFVLTSAKRTRTEQQRLYNAWLKGLSPFPASAPGSSSHELGLAVDLARLGKPAAEDPLLRQLGAAWKAAGGVWGGESDPVHFGAPLAWKKQV